MYKIEVGKPLIPGKKWPDGVVEYNYYRNGHELRIFLADLKRDEINAIKQDKCEFGLIYDKPVIFFLYKFYKNNRGRMEVILDGDAPYTIHKIPVELRDLPLIPDGDRRIPLQIILVEANTGIVKALRLVSLSPEFSFALVSAINLQEKARHDEATHAKHIKNIYAKYSTSEAMFKFAILKCVGGE